MIVLCVKIIVSSFPGVTSTCKSLQVFAIVIFYAVNALSCLSLSFFGRGGVGLGVVPAVAISFF